MWNPVKIRKHPDGRRVLFVQHETTREIRKTHTDVLERMSPERRAQLPVYRENPKYITRGASGGGEVARWPQVADIVHCGQLVFGECIEESVEGVVDFMFVRRRDGRRERFPLEDLEVVHHNIEGMGAPVEREMLESCTLGLQTAEEMSFAASEALARTTDRIMDMPADTTLDRALILDIHNQIFGRVFDWGGRFRRVGDIVVGKQEFSTPEPQFVDDLMREFEDELKQVESELGSELRSSNPNYWRKLASIYFRLCEIHPFRDGNGRVSRLLMTLLLVQSMSAPVPLDWDVLSRGQRKTDRAFEAARLKADLWPLARLVFRVFEKTAEALNRKPPKVGFGGSKSFHEMRE